MQADSGHRYGGMSETNSKPSLVALGVRTVAPMLIVASGHTKEPPMAGVAVYAEPRTAGQAAPIEQAEAREERPGGQTPLVTLSRCSIQSQS